MAIQWYPGHMHKAQKDIRELLPQVDLLIEVLDARIPYSSENPSIAKIRGDKPCIKILSKSDLADPLVTAAWQTHLELQRGVKTLATTTDEPAKIKQLLTLCRQMFPAKDAGVKTINAMIVGIPNVGKSTIINTLADRVIAKTGNEPAVTKSQQRINLGSGIVLFDTPGILWPKIENPNSSYRLAVTGAIKSTAMEYDDVGFYAADYLIKAYPELLKERFQLESIPDTELAFLEVAALRRGALSAGGRINLHKICELLINELRAGTVGRISLETPDMVVAEEIIIAEAQAKKAADAAERKRRFKQGSRNPSESQLAEQEANNAKRAPRGSRPPKATKPTKSRKSK